MKVERAEVAAEARRVAGHEVGHRPERVPRGGLVARLARQAREAEERLDRDRAAARHRVVEEVPGTHDEPLVVHPRVVEAFEPLVPEEPQRLVGEGARLVEPAAVEGRLVHVDQRRGDERPVLEVALELRLTRLPRAEEPAVAAHVAQDELRVPDRGGDVVGPVERPAGLGEGAAREPVPPGQDLVVACGVDPALPRRVELAPDASDPLGLGLAGHEEDALALEVRAPVHAPVLRRVLGVGGPEDLPQLVGRPDEELALVALGVGVLRRVETAGRVGHLAQDVVERLFRDAPAVGVAEGEPRVQVERRELGVVVEHLLKVGHEPVGVHRVPVEAAADLVVHAAARHHRERRVRHLPRARVLRALPEAQDEVPDHRLRELRLAAEAPIGVVELLGELLETA